MSNNFRKTEGQHNRIYGLDILRAVAILTVMLWHGRYFIPKQFKGNYDLVVNAVDGVALFFVLSGFLIGGILIKVIERERVGPVSLYNFWIKRWIRTLPNYYLTLTGLTLLSAFIIKTDLNLADAPKYYTFLQNFDRPTPEFFAESWSLSVEEWFYLITPVLIFSFIGIFRMKNRSAILTTAFLLIGLVNVLRFYRAATLPLTDHHSWVVVFQYRVVARLDSIMFGVLAAYVAHYHSSLWQRFRKPLLVTGIGLVLGAYFLDLSNSLYLYLGAFTVTSVGVMFLLPYLSTYKHGAGRIHRAVTHISLISYSMYLLNFSFISNVVLIWLSRHLYPASGPASSFLNTYGNLFLFWALTIGLSTLIYYYFEQPVLRLRDKLLIKDKRTSNLPDLEKSSTLVTVTGQKAELEKNS